MREPAAETERASASSDGAGAGGAGAPPERSAPEDPRLVAAHDAFDRGDFATLRRLTRAVERAERGPGGDRALADAARRLRRRVEVDPMQVVVLVACLALWAFLAFEYLPR
ncbi:MAG: hypothetical protein KC543_11640 [Myxococcales bacterium]|nr:hypothetical protein [Myxococcales bacterium]